MDPARLSRRGTVGRVMRRFAGKLAFVHRTLWQRETAYRWAALLGPPPLIGVGLVLLCLSVLPKVWPGVAHRQDAAPWAHRAQQERHADEVFPEATLPLPARDAGGGYRGFRAGWLGEVHPMTVDATRDANISEAALANFSIDQTDLALQRVVDAGPPSGLFAANALAFFVVPKAGVYGFSVRLARSGTQSADCVVRLNSKHHRMIRNLNIGTDGNAVLSYPETHFQIEPGLFGVVLAVGCWRGDHVLGDGDLTLMVRPPGEAGLRPAEAGELLRPVR